MKVLCLVAMLLTVPAVAPFKALANFGQSVRRAFKVPHPCVGELKAYVAAADTHRPRDGSPQRPKDSRRKTTKKTMKKRTTKKTTKRMKKRTKKTSTRRRVGGVISKARRDECLAWCEREGKRDDLDGGMRRELRALQRAVRDLIEAKKLQQEAQYLVKIPRKELDNGQSRSVQGLEREARNASWRRAEHRWEEAE